MSLEDEIMFIYNEVKEKGLQEIVDDAHNLYDVDDYIEEENF